MAELDRFDSQLAAAVRAFADRARTEVDAVAVATHATRGRRAGAAGWFGRTVPVPVVLILALLLLALLMTALAAGGWLPFRSAVLPVAPSASEAIAEVSPAGPSADALGRVHVSGTETTLLDTGYSTTVVGDVTQLRGGVLSMTTQTNDPRANGTGRFAFSVDIVGGMGVEWGTYRLETGGGVWEGSCSGSTWNAGEAAIGGCWLTGSGAFAGFTYYRGYSWVPGSVWVEGIIYPGPLPGN